MSEQIGFIAHSSKGQPASGIFLSEDDAWRAFSKFWPRPEKTKEEMLDHGWRLRPVLWRIVEDAAEREHVKYLGFDASHTPVTKFHDTPEAALIQARTICGSDEAVQAFAIEWRYKPTVAGVDVQQNQVLVAAAGEQPRAFLVGELRPEIFTPLVVNDSELKRSV